MSEIKRSFPKAQVILMTPVHRGFAVFSDDNDYFKQGAGAIAQMLGWDDARLEDEISRCLAD